LLDSLLQEVLGMYRIWCGIGVSVFIYDMMRDKSDDIQIRRVNLENQFNSIPKENRGKDTFAELTDEELNKQINEINSKRENKKF